MSVAAAAAQKNPHGEWGGAGGSQSHSAPTHLVRRPHTRRVRPAAASWVPGSLLSELKTAQAMSLPDRDRNLAFMPHPSRSTQEAGVPAPAPVAIAHFPRPPGFKPMGFVPTRDYVAKLSWKLLSPCHHHLSRLADFHKVPCGMGSRMASLHRHWSLGVPTKPVPMLLLPLFSPPFTNPAPVLARVTGF